MVMQLAQLVSKPSQLSHFLLLFLTHSFSVTFCLLQDYGNFVKYVCEAYSGSHVPEACKEMPKSAKTSAAEKETGSLLKQMRPKWKIGW